MIDIHVCQDPYERFLNENSVEGRERAFMEKRTIGVHGKYLYVSYPAELGTKQECWEHLRENTPEEVPHDPSKGTSHIWGASHAHGECWRWRTRVPKAPPNVAVAEDMEPDWTRSCINCDARPIVPLTEMCGPCTFGEADTAGGDW